MLRRNDALYKATTTTSTTTTTQAPPPTTTTQTPERPLRRPGSARRPLRRRRPQHDYYYDDDEDYLEEDYVEERINRRRKPGRQRIRRPEYDDYDSPRAHKDMDEESYPLRPMHRDRSRTRDEDLDDYDYDRRSYDRPRSRLRPSMDSRRHMDEDRRSFADDDERKPALIDSKRKPIERRPLARRPVVSEDRRSNGDDRRSVLDEPRRRRPYSNARPMHDEDEEIDPPARKQSSATLRDDYDLDEPRPAAKRPVTAQEPKLGVIPKVRSSSAVASIFSRPRAPPKISRPVPTNEKKKYEYQPQAVKPPTDAPATAVDEAPLYDDDYDYETEAPKSPPPKHERPETKKHPSILSHRDSRLPLTASKEDHLLNTKPHPIEDEDRDDRVTSSKPQRSTLNNLPASVATPVRVVKPEFVDARSRGAPAKVDQKPIVELEPEEEELGDDGEFAEYSDEEIDPKLENAPPKQAEVERVPVVEDDRRDDYRSAAKEPEPASRTVSVESARSHSIHQDRSNVETLPPYKPQLQRLTSPPPSVPTSVKFDNEDGRYYEKSGTRIESSERDVYTLFNKEHLHAVPPQPSGFKSIGHERDDSDPYKLNRSYIRIMKRPFLPSRGGSPYLPRGLKPVGVGITNTDYPTGPSTLAAGTEPTPVSGSIRLPSLLNSEPISRINFNSNFPSAPAQAAPIGSRPTHPPQIESPRNPLDDIYNSDYDVTINDALNPTLKPITQSHESSVTFDLPKYSNRHNPYARADVLHAPSQFRSTAVRAPLQSPPSRQSAPSRSRAPQQYYDDYDY